MVKKDNQISRVQEPAEKKRYVRKDETFAVLWAVMSFDRIYKPEIGS